MVGVVSVLCRGQMAVVKALAYFGCKRRTLEQFVPVRLVIGLIICLPAGFIMVAGQLDGNLPSQICLIKN